MNVQSSKAWIRTYLLNRRRQLSDPKRRSKNKEILKVVLRSAVYRKSKTVAVYLSFGTEVDTRGLIRRAFRDRKTVLVPVTRHGLDRAVFQEIFSTTRFRKTKIGPMEPDVIGPAFSFQKIDLILVPGLGFDSLGYRIGFGSGTYDRLLKKSTMAVSMGIFYSEQYVKYLPHEKHDYPLDKIVFK